MGSRFVVLTASMGAGHDAVAYEMSRRLVERGDQVEVLDILMLLPAGIGRGLRACYAQMVNRAPWLYEAVYQLFFTSRDGLRGETGPVVTPLTNVLRRRWSRDQPDGVISVFHLAAQACGRLREEGTLRAPSAVFVTDFAAHRQWVHPGNDLHLCLTDDAAAAVKDLGGRDARVVGPVVPPAFLASPDPPDDGSVAGMPIGDGIPVLVSSGAWGLGPKLAHTAITLARGGYTAIVLCGRDERLRRRLADTPGILPLGWVADMPALLASTRALVDNAAGQTAVQALALGVPVVAYRPLPGHGADGVLRMARAGVALAAADESALLAALDRVTVDGDERARLTRAGRALFVADAAAVVSGHDWARDARTQPNRRARVR